MIFDRKSREIITSMPHRMEFDIWKSSIPQKEFENILNYVNSFIDEKESFSLKDIAPSEGKWTESVFAPVFLKACFMDEKLSLLFLELIVWHIVQNRQDKWYFDNEEGSKIYFKITV